MNGWPHAGKEDLAREAEAYETDPWAVEAILGRELMTKRVLDPCCGRGIMANAAHDRGHFVTAFDLYDWGCKDFPGGSAVDFLTWKPPQGVDWGEFTVFMNPPFSKAEAFVEHSEELGARKIICFQRFAWWEGQKRGSFWDEHPPNRVYVCAARATCWRIDIPPEERKSGSPTAHAWFVWERGHPGGTLLGRLEKVA